MSKFSFDNTVNAIRQTRPGRERNMYPHIRDLLTGTFGHPTAQILVDSTSDQAQGIPDLMIQAPTGLKTKKGEPDLCEWVVIEAKDEPGVFHAPESRELVFSEKSKYIGLFTEWFLMIDPEVLVARPVTMRSQLDFDPLNDVVVEWATATEESIKNQLWFLDVELAGVTSSLKAFRSGDESKIAVIKLRVNDEHSLNKYQKARLKQSKRDFYEAVSSATGMLQQACVNALAAQKEKLEVLVDEANEFGAVWGGYEVSFSPFKLKGLNIYGPEEVREHDKQVSRLKQKWLKSPALAKLAFQWLPAFHERMGSTTKDHHFAIETANLILARILLIRFFEDQGFFEDKKYVCNGGVAAFQQMMEYFSEGYTQLLKHAYDKAHDIYAAVFDEMDLDWVLGVENQQLSNAIEMSMMLLSRFDFQTVKGDILTGIYDRFLDSKKRKDMGEYYTPPSIARYIVRKLGIQAGDSVVDPSCGSGTFLLEAYDHLVGADISDGLAGFEEAKTTLAGIGGMDLNPFAAMIAQVQMLWHLLPMKVHLQAEGFPELRVAERINSLVQNRTEFQGTLFGELNQPVHAAVVGNPPYVRPERGMQLLDGIDANWFAELGSVDKNLFGLFIYKSLNGLCRPQTDLVSGGKLGFVVPLSFCDNDDNANLRKLFEIGGKFTLLEIVDMEVIAPYVFDAAVNPIVLIAQNRPATANDKVTIRVAGASTVVDAKSHIFDLDLSSREEFAYADVWSNDGRILTKITARRQQILAKLSQLPTFENAAQHFWIGKKGASIDKWQLQKPENLNAANMLNGIRWEEQAMIRRGCVFRNEKPLTTEPDRKFDFYKGENITAGAVEGEPVESGIDIDGISDNALWRFRDVLPTKGYAFLQIALGVTCAPFDPRKLAFLDTASLFFPDDRHVDFPFDIATLSRVYQFYYALQLRLGAMSHSFRSHLYPTNLRMLPWSENLKEHTEFLEAKRPEFLRLCVAIYSRPLALQTILTDGNAVSLKQACKAANAKIIWPEHMLDGDPVDVVANTPTSVSAALHDDVWRIQLNSTLLDFVDLSDHVVAQSLCAALTALDGQSVKFTDLLKQEIPTAESMQDFVAQVNVYDAGGSRAALDALLDEIDSKVGQALGLNLEDVVFIQQEMRDDDFLRKIRPNLPHSGKRHRGLSQTLASPQRYVSEA
jgi:hypothetical protein